MSVRDRLLVATAALAFVASLVLPVSADAQADAVRKLVGEDYDRADNARNLTAKMQLYASDAVLMPPGQTAVVGQQAIRAWHQALYEREGFQGASTVEEVETFGDWGFARGKYSGVVTSKTGGKASRVSGNFLVVVRRQADGAWKIAREIWTQDSAKPGTE